MVSLVIGGIAAFLVLIGETLQWRRVRSKARLLFGPDETPRS